ncbi:MAG: type II toxin-antitoxin system RelE/ParE family toxin [Acidobacteriota bacterium]|nr:type II toxin-antitoxin system RelE/ParE family toxin [Acidobacteriota bacterium]
MSLNWGRRAQRDLHELIVYIAEDSIQTAELVASRILRSAELLAQRPRAGRRGRVNGTRELVVLRTPYILVYRATARNVRVLRDYHGARRWPSRFD